MAELYVEDLAVGRVFELAAFRRLFAEGVLNRTVSLGSPGSTSCAGSSRPAPATCCARAPGWSPAA